MRNVIPVCVAAFHAVKRDLQPLAGSKGGTLARLSRLGVRIPDGFVILSTAFHDDEPTEEAWRQIGNALTRLRRGARQAAGGGDGEAFPSRGGSATPGPVARVAFAVRSSAAGEDSVQASFAGEFETVLDTATDEEVRDAIRRVRCSRHAARVETYGRAKGLTGEHEMAVIVQRMVQPDVSGVLFTVDPVTGGVERMSGNFVHGRGDLLVSGEANPLPFTFSRPRGAYEGPKELEDAGRELFRAARRLERELGGPQDIEWAVAGGRVWILQSRPITTLGGWRPDTAEWNDSFTGCFLWSGTNLAEQAPEVRTPFSCSMLKAQDSLQAFKVGPYPLNGIIGGRAYSNLSVLLSAYRPLFGGNMKKAVKMLEATFGSIPDGIDIPAVPVTSWQWWTRILPGLLGYVGRMRRLTHFIPGFVSGNPGECARMRDLVRRAPDAASLGGLWRAVIQPRFTRGLLLLYASTIDISPRLERKLRGMVGPEDAGILLSNLRGLSGGLESLGPVRGIGMVERGEMSRREYMEAYGHRGENEFEYAWPRPMEEPAWLDRRLEEHGKSPVDVETLLGAQKAAYDAAWGRFAARYPRQARGVEKALVRAAGVARRREEIRSEAIRCMAVIRAFALRAGELLGIGGDVFYLTIAETEALLAGGCDAALRFIPARRETHARYKALPPYPVIIVGRFDPFSWAADPARRSDLFIADAPVRPLPASRDGPITGFAGAPGIVEGVVRRLDRVEDGVSFLPGEILVSPTTNIGWTLLFPRAAAIVTDIGAPLSHASIVARELGIPAVVGCGNATMRLSTGDRVRVDGGRGTVEIVTPGR